MNKRFGIKAYLRLPIDQQHDVWRYIILFMSGISAFLIPLLHIGQTALVRDWGYFNALSHVVRSSVLHYHTFPLHNPWVLGGVDILANPQSRVFSPFVLYDLLFSAPYANLYALITLAIIGSFGFYKLLTYLGIHKNIAVMGSIVFIHGSWFALHFTEGHITFGSFLLMGLAFYYILRLQEQRYKLYYVLLNAFFLLDGAIYVFIFTNLLLIFSVVTCTHELRPLKLLKSIYQHWKTSVLSLFLFICFASVKLIPFLMLHRDRHPYLEAVSIPWNFMVHILFDPCQEIMKLVDGQYFGFGFHEMGVYIGLLSFVLVGSYLFITRKRTLIPYVFIMLLFFWIGTGWLEVVNPWQLFQKLPIVNNAHVQSRLFIVPFLIFVVLLCFALNYYRTKWRPIYIYGIMILLVMEALFVSAYPYYMAFTYKDASCRTEKFNRLITSTTIDKTIASTDPSGFCFEHYFYTNTGAKNTYEPAAIQGDIFAEGDSLYKGEIFLATGAGNVSLESYTPAHIHIHYDLDRTSEIGLNTNYLLGWKSSNPSVTIADSNGTLVLKPTNLKGEADIIYRPNYLYIILPLFAIGLLLSIFVLIKRK